jgi:hypothetical protein
MIAGLLVMVTESFGASEAGMCLGDVLRNGGALRTSLHVRLNLGPRQPSLAAGMVSVGVGPMWPTGATLVCGYCRSKSLMTRIDCSWNHRPGTKTPKPFAEPAPPQACFPDRETEAWRDTRDGHMSFLDVLESFAHSSHHSSPVW